MKLTLKMNVKVKGPMRLFVRNVNTYNSPIDIEALSCIASEISTNVMHDTMTFSKKCRHFETVHSEVPIVELVRPIPRSNPFTEFGVNRFEKSRENYRTRS